jgi:hypothetical protein
MSVILTSQVPSGSGPKYHAIMKANELVSEVARYSQQAPQKSVICCLQYYSPCLNQATGTCNSEIQARQVFSVVYMCTDDNQQHRGSTMLRMRRQISLIDMAARD